MWVVTVHGSDISPTFTHVLQHSQRYAVGKAEGSHIRLSGARVKPLEGHLCVAPWTPDGPADGKTVVTWEPAPDKNGAVSVNKLKLQHPADQESWHTLTTPDFAIEEIQEGFEMLQPGDGVKFAGENWFCTTWQPLKIVDEQLKDIPQSEQSILRSFSIPLVAVYNPATPPTHVVSPTLKNNKPCFFAVSQAAHIVKAPWITELQTRLMRNWDAQAIGTDSFEVPDEQASEFKPEIDAGMLQERRIPELWMPNVKRKEMWKGWTLVAVFPGRAPPDTKYLATMGAEVQPIDATKEPPLTADQFAGALRVLRQTHVAAGRDASKIYIVFFAGANKKAKNWEEVYVKSAIDAGLGLFSSKALWKMIAAVDPESIIRGNQPEAGPNATNLIQPPSDDVTGPAPTSVASTKSPSERPAAVSPPPEASRPARHQDFIPSTHTDESDSRPLAGGSVSPVKSPVKKPLRRRGAARKDYAANLLDDIEMEPPLPSAQASVDRETSLPQESYETSPVSQAAPARLRRRGAQRATLDDFSFGDLDMDSAAMNGMTETQNKLARHQALYQQSRGTSQAYRKVISEAIGEELEEEEVEVEEIPVQAPETQTQNQTQPSWLTGEVDFVQRSINRNNQQRLRAEQMAREEEEEEEEIEAPQVPAEKQHKSPSDIQSLPMPAKKAEPPKKKKTTASGPSQPTRDEDFLQAVKTATKGKKALDAFDKEFNQLRIAKPGAAVADGKVLKQTEHDAARPDYGIVKDFDHTTTGDFIVIERVNLFRPDSRPSPVQTFGGPNFKKFKKKNIVRPAPVPMKLSAAPAQTYGVDDAYWKEEVSASQSRPFRRPGDSQDSAMIDETQMKTKKAVGKKKREIHDSDDDMLGELPAAKRPRARTQASASVSTRTRRSTTVEPPPEPSPPPRARNSRAKAKAAPIIIEDSDDDQPDPPSRVTPSLSATLDFGPTLSTQDASAAAGPASSSGRRKRLAPVDDDTSGLVFGSSASKRRRRG